MQETAQYLEKRFIINRSWIFIGLPKFYATPQNYEIFSKSLVPYLRRDEDGGGRGWSRGGSQGPWGCWAPIQANCAIKRVGMWETTPWGNQIDKKMHLYVAQAHSDKIHTLLYTWTRVPFYRTCIAKCSHSNVQK
jgi:hypothetical protein